MLWMMLRPTAALALMLLAGQAAAQQGEFFIPGGQRPPGAPPGQPAGQRPPQGGQPPANQPRRPPAPVIGVVDVPEIQRVSTAFTSVREEIERRRNRLNEDLQREQQRWREEQQMLAQSRAILPPDQLRNRERDLQDRISDAQRIFRDRQRGIEQAAQGALVQIEQALAGAIRQVAAARGMNMVLPRPLVIWNEPPFDMTAEVAEILNRTLRSVPMAPDEAAPAPPGAPAPAAAPTTPPAAAPNRPAAPAPAAPAAPPRRN
jgi:Skp family chaperone for outer membrane proteins